jgi:predicted amidophosphoribosyltransferase
LLASNLRAQAAFLHAGPARAIVHNFKYRGIARAGRFLAESMAPLVPENCTLVPLPRVDWRLLRYGVDPAPELARLLGVLTSTPVSHLLAVPVVSPDQARRSRSDRRPPMFRLSNPAPGPLVLVDDVVTTGGTLESAHRLFGSAVVVALTATASAR